MRRILPTCTSFACLAMGASSLLIHLPAQAATDSATGLLQDLEQACITSNPDSGLGNDFPVEEVSARPLMLARSLSASPDSTLCENVNSELSDIDEMNGNDPAALSAARAAFAAEITPDEVPAMYTSLVQLSADQIRNVSHHLRGRRQANSGDSADTAAINGLNGYIGGTAGEQPGRFSVFVDGAKVDGNQDQTAFEVGYDLETDHFTVGVDYRISADLIAGFAYGKSDTTLEYSEAQNQTDNTTDHYIVYSSWYRDNFAVDTLIAHATGEFDTERAVVGTTALGSTDNKITYASLAGSYDFVDGALTYGTFASFDYLEGEIDAFEESNGGGWAVAFAKQDVKSQIYAMGGHANYAISFGWGVLIPHVRAEWRTELEDDRDFVVGRFVEDPTSSFTLGTDDPDSNWYQASAGVSAQLPHGIALFVDYEEIFEYDDTDLSSVTAGVRWEL
ncbi:MAG: autotransporter outer membrane beta-barrel domain-containing protein [Gammaproteobacteria bacterium]